MVTDVNLHHVSAVHLSATSARRCQSPGEPPSRIAASSVSAQRPAAGSCLLQFFGGAFLSSTWTFSSCRSKHLESIKNRMKGGSSSLLCQCNFAHWKKFLLSGQIFSLPLCSPEVRACLETTSEFPL